jgi:sugar phosphate isomerase/epimerase
MNASSISRRSFITSLGLGAAAASLGGGEPLQAASRSSTNNLKLGMMLQGNSAAELHEKAKAMAAVGFDTVQLTFFFQPSPNELESLARALKELKLRTVAFGTYFNLFRPEDTSFMGASLATMETVAKKAELFNCRQFVTWSGSYAAHFAGHDLRNHTSAAVLQMRGAIRQFLLPILDPMGGGVAFEPYYPHILGSIDLAKDIFAPFPPQRVGLLVDPPNFISPELYPQREEEMGRLFRDLGDRIHLAHFKDMKLNAAGTSVELPGPGAGEMNYPRFISELRKLDRSMPCIIEHIEAAPGAMMKTKAWAEKMLD